MIFFDLFKMSFDNLLRRRLRTMLTILGVIIGTASIVVMLSLGLGLKRSSLKQIEQYGGITTINVYEGEGQLDEKGQQKEALFSFFSVIKYKIIFIPLTGTEQLLSSTL